MRLPRYVLTDERLGRLISAALIGTAFGCMTANCYDAAAIFGLLGLCTWFTSGIGSPQERAK